MMKSLLFVFAIAVLTGSASALTYNWTHLTPTGATTTAGRVNGNADPFKGNTVWNDTKGTFAIVADMTSIGSGTVASTGGNGFSNNFHFTLGIVDGQWTVSGSGFTNTATVTDTTADRTVATGKNIIGFSIVRGIGTTTTTISINGIAIATVVGNCNGPVGSWSWGETTSETDAYTGTAAYDAYLLPGGQNIALTPEQINQAFAAVPEPTVLALLALGVAGLALRRRAA